MPPGQELTIARKTEVNAIANFCFLTKDTNLNISDRLPEVYFSEVEQAHPGALRSQWIPMDPSLWKVENFKDFLEARKQLLADELNQRMAELLHGDERWLAGSPSPPAITPTPVAGGITSGDEEAKLETVNAWVQEKGLPSGILAFELSDPETGQQQAVFDLAWPHGLQEELTQPVCLLLNESNEVFAAASQAGFRCFATATDLKHYLRTEILVDDASE